MAGDLIRFVDSIAATPAVRLDLNDEQAWAVTSFEAPPPRLRRALTQNAMRNGGYVSSSQHEMRVLTIGLELITADQDSNAAQIQTLARELDRESNLLMYQPTGATKPVFFRVFRSDIAQLADVIAQKAMRTLTVELLAEPYALGLREDAVANRTVSNQAASTGPGQSFWFGVNAANTKGDVAAPLLVWSSATNAISQTVMLAAGLGQPPGYEAEAGSNGTDTTDVTADATYSNSAGKATSFATNTGMAARVLTIPGATVKSGLYRLLLRCKKSVAADAMNVQLQFSAPSGYTSPVTAVPASSTEFQIVDLGTISVPFAANPGGSVGYRPAVDTKAFDVTISAQRVSGTGTLSFDYVALVPLTTSAFVSFPTGVSGTLSWVLDGITDSAYYVDTNPTDPAAVIVSTPPVTWTGRLPIVQPGQTIDLSFIRTGTAPLSDTTTLNVSYWPRYLYVRPATS